MDSSFQRINGYDKLINDYNRLDVVRKIKYALSVYGKVDDAISSRGRGEGNSVSMSVVGFNDCGDRKSLDERLQKREEDEKDPLIAYRIVFDGDRSVLATIACGHDSEESSAASDAIAMRSLLEDDMIPLDEISEEESGERSAFPRTTYHLGTYDTAEDTLDMLLTQQERQSAQA